MSGRNAATVVLVVLVLAGCAGGASRPADQTGATGFPTGSFETRITRQDLRSKPFPLSNAHVETLTFRDGRWRDVWLPRRPDQPPAGGRLVVRGDTVRFTPTFDVLRWNYYRGELTFRVVSVPDAFARFTYAVHPWRKVK